MRQTNSDSGRQLLPSILGQRAITPPIVIDALIERIVTRYSRSYIETGPLEVLAVLDVGRLLAEDWHPRWSDWLPDGRALWCDVVCEAKLTTIEQRVRAITLLSVLARDGNYPVRRSAFRALATVDPDALVTMCREWSKAKAVSTRVRAAEAAAWIPTDAYSDDEVQSLGLTADCARVVREASKSILLDRRNRDWAATYLEIVLQVGVSGGPDVSDVYRFGRALERLGDDWTVRQLRSQLSNTLLPRHVVHWISRIVDGIENRWRQIVLEWREPSFNWEGTIEEVDGVIRHPTGKEIPVTFLCGLAALPVPPSLGTGAAWEGRGRRPTGPNGSAVRKLKSTSWSDSLQTY